MPARVYSSIFIRKLILKLYYQTYIYIYIWEYESYITVIVSNALILFIFQENCMKLFHFIFFNIINIKEIILQQSLVHNSAVNNCLLRVMES